MLHCNINGLFLPLAQRALELVQLALEALHVGGRRRRGAGRGLACTQRTKEASAREWVEGPEGVHRRERLRALLGLQVHLEGEGDVAAEELGQGVVSEANQLVEQGRGQ